jgi:hypothetical protein
MALLVLLRSKTSRKPVAVHGASEEGLDERAWGVLGVLGVWFPFQDAACSPTLRRGGGRTGDAEGQHAA